MSRVAKAPVEVPAGVTVTLSGQDITVKGPVGELNSQLLTVLLKFLKKKTTSRLKLLKKAKLLGLQAGTARALHQQHDCWR